MMFTKLQAKLRNKKGFTLVELLIVIAVLGIIAAIAVPRFTGVLSGVKNKAEVSSAKMIVKEVEAEFMLENWTFPSDNIFTVVKLADTVDKSTGYNGEIPLDEKGVAMKITITKSGDKYTLKITDGDSTPNTLVEQVINGPIK